MLDPVKVLVVEDDKKLASFLTKVMTEEGYTVDSCASGDDAVEFAMTGIYSLIILDRMIPDLDGIGVCKKLRRLGNTVPILILSARGETTDRVIGLDAGADDYMAKPFEVVELLARVSALIRRSEGQSRLKFGPLEIDRSSRLVLLDGKSVELTAREFALMLHLALRSDRIVTRTELLSQVWATQFDPESNVVEVHISRLRDKLGDHSWMVDTVRGRGYRMRTKAP
jgi:DNA-binding response OmpR family regulator